MVALSEALAIEKAKRDRDASEAYTKQELRKVVLGALAERLNESAVPKWLFQVEGDRLAIFFGEPGSQSEVAAWRLDDHVRLVLRDDATEWVTAESFARVVDQAVRMTAKLIVDVETGDNKHDPGIVELRPRF